MRALLQRVSSASVMVAGRVTGKIGTGLLVFQGVEHADSADDGQWLADKIAKLRIFGDETGAMNKSITDIGGEILLVSQFTLHASTQKGNRPSFNAAAKSDHARPLYEQFIAQLSTALAKPIQTGEFAADMKVSLTNDGPVTLLLDSKRRD